MELKQSGFIQLDTDTAFGKIRLLMSLKETLSYISGFDLIQKELDYAQELLTDRIGEPGLYRPIDGGLNIGARIYATRIKAFIEIPMIMALRIIGVDYALMKLREELNNLK